MEKEFIEPEVEVVEFETKRKLLILVKVVGL